MDKLTNKEDQGQCKGKICERKSRYVRIIGVWTQIMWSEELGISPSSDVLYSFPLSVCPLSAFSALFSFSMNFSSACLYLFTLCHHLIDRNCKRGNRGRNRRKRREVSCAVGVSVLEHHPGQRTGIWGKTFLDQETCCWLVVQVGVWGRASRSVHSIIYSFNKHLGKKKKKPSQRMGWVLRIQMGWVLGIWRLKETGFLILRRSLSHILVLKCGLGMAVPTPPGSLSGVSQPGHQPRWTRSGFIHQPDAQVICISIKM